MKVKEGTRQGKKVKFGKMMEMLQVKTGFLWRELLKSKTRIIKTQSPAKTVKYILKQ